MDSNVELYLLTKSFSVARTRTEVHSCAMTGQSSLMAKEEEEEDEGNGSSDSDRKSKMSCSYLTRSRSIRQSSILDKYPTAAAMVHGRRMDVNPQRTLNSGLVSSIQISATHILDLRAADRRQRQHRAISQTLKMITRLRGQPSQPPDRHGTAAHALSPPHPCRADPRRATLRERAA